MDGAQIFVLGYFDFGIHRVTKMSSRLRQRDRLVVLAALAALAGSPVVAECDLARLAVAWPALLRNAGAGRIQGVIRGLEGLGAAPVAALDSAKRFGIINEGNAATLSHRA
jgi:hypothetical protein